MTLTFGSLFAGIGGFDLGFERAGMECRWQVEIDPYAQKILNKHWPNVGQWDDVRTFPPTSTEDWEVDVICGGFPCQGISAAGTGAGLEDHRSGLWAEYIRIIRVLRPTFVAIENSPMLIVRGLKRVLRDLAAGGFDAEWQVIQASDFALPHSRKRLFVVAYANGEHGQEGVGAEPHGQREVFDRNLRERIPVWVQAADHFVGVDDGVRGRAYQHRGRAVGNAVVPQIAEWIGKRIVESFGEQS